MNDPEKKFKEMVAGWNITEEQKEAMWTFIEEYGREQYDQGSDAEAYSNAMNS